MKRVLLLILVFALLIPIGITTAQEPGTKADNACYEGGSMAGKCDTEWEWVCGYYLARWESAGGWNTPNNLFNSACISLLPPPPVAGTPVAEVLELCRTGGGVTFCIYSNGVATGDTGSNGSIDNVALHTTGPIPASCPSSFAGRVFFGTITVAASTLNFLFTPSELSAFGFTTNICIY